jgi:hypothetical protein
LVVFLASAKKNPPLVFDVGSLAFLQSADRGLDGRKKKKKHAYLTILILLLLASVEPEV